MQVGGAYKSSDSVRRVADAVMVVLALASGFYTWTGADAILDRFSATVFAVVVIVLVLALTWMQRLAWTTPGMKAHRGVLVRAGVLFSLIIVSLSSVFGVLGMTMNPARQLEMQGLVRDAERSLDELTESAAAHAELGAVLGSAERKAKRLTSGEERGLLCGAKGRGIAHEILSNMDRAYVSARQATLQEQIRSKNAQAVAREAIREMRYISSSLDLGDRQAVRRASMEFTKQATLARENLLRIRQGLSVIPMTVASLTLEADFEITEAPPTAASRSKSRRRRVRAEVEAERHVACMKTLHQTLEKQIDTIHAEVAPMKLRHTVPSLHLASEIETALAHLGELAPVLVGVLAADLLGPVLLLVMVFLFMRVAGRVDDEHSSARSSEGPSAPRSWDITTKRSPNPDLIERARRERERRRAKQDSTETK